jgi:hypothetical protein
MTVMTHISYLIYFPIKKVQITISHVTLTQLIIIN